MGVASDIFKMHNVTASSFCPLFWQEGLYLSNMDACLMGDGQASVTFVDRQEGGLEER